MNIDLKHKPKNKFEQTYHKVHHYIRQHNIASGIVILLTLFYIAGLFLLECNGFMLIIVTAMYIVSTWSTVALSKIES